MGALSDQFQRSWPEEGVMDLKQELTTLTMHIIGQVLFDGELVADTTTLGSAAATIAAYLAHVLLKPFSFPYHWPTPRNRRAHQAIQAGRECLQRLIAERRQPLVERQDVLSLLLQARDAEGQAMTDEQVMAECLTLFVAGYETTATALTWTWYLLCQHPEAYEQMQEEVDTILQGRTPTYDDLAQLPYCLQVFKEALRLYPPAHILSRRAVRDVEIDGYRVPQGWSVLVVPYLLHRREDYFPDPEHFDPTRFSPQREKQLPRYAYLPFGAGPRICIGLHFAMMEGHLLLASLAQRSRFSLLAGQSIEPDPLHNLILRPSGPVHVLRTRR
jgi:cytochrome P450